MWMLLGPCSSRGTSEEVAAANAATSPRATHVQRSAGNVVAGNGTAPVEALLAVIGATPNSGRGEDVAIFMHPGRALLATVSLDRLFDQFDCRARDVYATLDEAEVAHVGDVGFLLEVRRTFTDNAGCRRDRGVLFASGVRG